MNKKFIAAFLCGLMCVTAAPLAAFAETTTKAKTESSQSSGSDVQRYDVLILGDKDQDGDNYVKELQTWLKHYGYFDEEPTGYFGEITQKAVIAFQEEHGMTADGKAGPATRKILLGEGYKAIPSSRKVNNALGATVGEYAPGDRGTEVTKIQKRLKELGYYTYSRITDYYGPITEEAVLDFKEANGLSTDSSKIDSKTYNKLFSDSAKKKSSSKSSTTTTKKSSSSSSSKSSSSKSSSSSSKSSSKVEKFVQTALNQQGDKYVYGSTGPNTFDCSGLVYYSLRQVGVTPPRTSSAQSQHSAWQKVSKSQLKRGDLVFFSSSSGGSNIGHVGIYLGSGQFVHASSGSKKSVIISSLNSGSYASRFRWGRRVF